MVSILSFVSPGLVGRPWRRIILIFRVIGIDLIHWSAARFIFIEISEFIRRVITDYVSFAEAAYSVSGSGVAKRAGPEKKRGEVNP